MMQPAGSVERRIMIVAPTGGDAQNVLQVLTGSGLHAEIFSSIGAAATEMNQGCGVLLVAEEALQMTHRQVLQSTLESQPKWSNVPIVLITSSGAEKITRNFRLELAPRAHVSLLERPLRTATLIAAAEAALNSRDQQYEIRDLLAEREGLLNSLEERVVERTTKLQAMVEEMEAFSYSVSHDLRAPLRVLSGYANAVREDYADQLPPEGHRLLEKISCAAERMDRLTQDLLAYTRIATGEVELAPLDLNEAVENVIEHYPSLLEAKSHISVKKQLGRCLGHSPSLTQCLSNLLENAVKFAKTGEAPQINVSSEKREGFVRVLVGDNGIGIDPEHQRRIFGLFERVNGKAAGTGIGLAIVKKAAERMKGAVGVESKRGEGTVFWIDLMETEV